MAKRQPKDPVTHRFQTTLTRDLCDRLCETHQAGKDYRNVTAARCGVHPVTLTKWLKLGSTDPDNGLAAELYMRFLGIEGEIRAAWIAEIANTLSLTEETEYGDKGLPISKHTTMRKTDGIRWLLERRFRQFRVEHVLTEHEQDAMALLQPAASALTPEMAEQICRMLASAPERLPPAIRTLFAATDWRPPKTLEAHGQETEH